MNKKIQAWSGHTLFIRAVEYEDLPDNVKKFEYMGGKEKWYAVHNWDKDGHVFMYVGKEKGIREYLVWYAKGGFWTSFGKTIEEAINGAQRDGWLYA